MDFAKLEKLNNGNFDAVTYRFNPIHPVTQQALDFEVEIRSIKSSEAVKYLDGQFRKAQIEEQKAARTNKANIQSLAEARVLDLSFAAVLTVAFHGITKGDKAFNPNSDEIREILSKQDWLVRQILDEGKNEANFLPL